MYIVYKITNKINSKYYIGMTKQQMSRRFSQHKASSKKVDPKNYLYNAMKKYGIENFIIEQLYEFTSKEECCLKEIECISKNLEGYNLAKGGETGFSMLEKSEQEIISWKEALSKGRQGRKPALGMKHSEENKILFSKVSREYWDTQNTYNWEDIKHCTYREAIEQFGISQTHYYRLKKESGTLSMNRSEAAKAGWEYIKSNNDTGNNEPV